MSSNDDTDKKVKDLLDPATRADLERWFNLPSFEQLGDRGVQPAPPPEDPEREQIRKRQAEALAAVDPALLEAHRHRVEGEARMLKPLPPLRTHVDPSIAQVNLSQIDRQHTIAEPRDFERPSQIEDDLHECAPQALLRDLHRPDQTFHKVFEIVDPIAEQRIDATAAVSEVMSTSWRVRSFVTLAHDEGRAVYADLRATRRQPWGELQLPNRPVTE